MLIKVTGYLKFKAVIGNQFLLELEAEKATLRDALRLLSRQYGKTFEEMVFDPQTREIRRSNLILLNGKSYLNVPNPFNTELKEGDEITLLPVVAGG
ncbi:MAG: MoaD/ThiS family protein [Desulfobacteraceae bacterium]|nr:MoaD/ThiS family protein [Desulfobacteraceae bacterium]